MTERASDLLTDLAERLSADSRDSGQVVAESVRTLEPELLRMQKDGGSIDELVRTSVGFHEILFRSLRADSSWRITTTGRSLPVKDGPSI